MFHVFLPANQHTSDDPASRRPEKFLSEYLISSSSPNPNLLSIGDKLGFCNVKTCGNIEEAEQKGRECLATVLNPPKPPQPPTPESGPRYLAMDPRHLCWAG